MLKQSCRFVFALLFVASFVISSFAARPVSSAPQSDPDAQLQNVLVEGVVGEISKLNPLLATYNSVDRDITSLIFEGLMTTDDYGEIVPDLAASWTVTADGLEYIIVLRDDVLWQDGIPFTTEDVLFTTQLMSNPDFPGATTLYEFWRTVEVNALDARTIRFRLTQPLASFLDQLRIGIVPAHVLSGTPAKNLEEHPFNLSPIGTGPYQLETLTATNGRIDGIQLRVAPVYRARPEGQEGYALDRVIFRTYTTEAEALEAFRQGEINSIGNIAADLQADARAIPGLSLYTTIQSHVGVLIYNWQNDATQFVRNPRARLAMARAVDRAGLVQQYLAGTAVVADSPLPSTSWAYLGGIEWPTYDLAAAQALLDTVDLTAAEATTAGEGSAVETQEAPDAGNGETPPETPAEAPVEAAPAEAAPADTTPADAPTDAETETEPAPEDASPEPTAEPVNPLTLTILTRDDPALVALVQGIAAGWTQIGFTVDVQAVDANTLNARLEAGDFDAALVEYSFEPNADPDPYVFWHQGQYQTGQNFGGMDDRRISEALENARRDPYGVNRIVYYHQFQQLFADRAPALVLYYPLYVYGADARLQNIQLGFMSSPSDRFRNIQDWTF